MWATKMKFQVSSFSQSWQCPLQSLEGELGKYMDFFLFLCSVPTPINCASPRNKSLSDIYLFERHTYTNMYFPHPLIHSPIPRNNQAALRSQVLHPCLLPECQRTQDCSRYLLPLSVCTSRELERRTEPGLGWGGCRYSKGRLTFVPNTCQLDYICHEVMGRKMSLGNRLPIWDEEIMHWRHLKTKQNI